MKINFTKTEYIALMEMIQIAGCVIHANALEQPTAADPYHALAEKVLSHAKEFGCADLVQFDQKRGTHSATPAFEDSVMPFIEEYDDDTFWGELTERLIERDLVRAVGEQQYLALDGAARAVKAQPYEQKYDTEFAEHGLERLEIVAGPLAAGHN